MLSSESVYGLIWKFNPPKSAAPLPGSSSFSGEIAIAVPEPETTLFQRVKAGVYESRKFFAQLWGVRRTILMQPAMDSCGLSLTFRSSATQNLYRNPLSLILGEQLSWREGEMINIHGSYFSIGNPLQMLDRWLHPVRHSKRVSLRNRGLEVEWTGRAQRELEKRDTPLVVEMQLMFSCVVKKRTIFHDSYDLETVAINDKLKVAFRPVEPTSCDPVEFATKYPVKREFDSTASLKIRPKHLLIDFVNGKWVGEFEI